MAKQPERYAAKLLILLLILLVWTGSFTAQAAESDTADGAASDETRTETGWVRKGTKTYYLDQNGKAVTGMVQIGGRYYYFNKKGVRKTGWKTVKGRKYYFDPAQNGARAVGLTKIGKSTWFFKKNGKYRTGWVKSKGNRYYFKSNGKMVTGWATINGARYYFKKKTGIMVTGMQSIGKKKYMFDENGKLLRQGYDADGNYIDAGGQVLRKSTIRQLLKTALEPVGSTMYIWGGGWNIADSGSGNEARTIGVSPRWKEYFEQQSPYYDYTKTRYQIHDGLDCSGYVGWVIYNTFNTTSGNAGYVMSAEVMARTYAGYGWGSYSAPGSFTDFRAGDIMSTSAGHVYIVVGQCSDGSVVLLHSSPKGVMISGTSTRAGGSTSQAIRLAEKYMKQYYPKWYAKYPEIARGPSYLTGYGRMRWHITGTNAVMSDPEDLRGKSAAAVLKNLFKA